MGRCNVMGMSGREALYEGRELGVLVRDRRMR
jgi:hypothetical protein